MIASKIMQLVSPHRFKISKMLVTYTNLFERNTFKKKPLPVMSNLNYQQYINVTILTCLLELVKLVPIKFAS